MSLILSPKVVKTCPNVKIARLRVVGQFDVEAARGPQLASPKAEHGVPATRRYKRPNYTIIRLRPRMYSVAAVRL